MEHSVRRPLERQGPHLRPDPGQRECGDAAEGSGSPVVGKTKSQTAPKRWSSLAVSVTDNEFFSSALKTSSICETLQHEMPPPRS